MFSRQHTQPPRPKESVSIQGGNGITKYWIHMPQNYVEYVLFLNIQCYYKKVSPRQDKIIIYDSSTSPDNIFTHYNLIKSLPQNTFSDDLEYIKKRYTLIHIVDLMLKIASESPQQTFKLNITNVFDKYFVTAQAMTRNYMRKKLNDKSVILIHLSPSSMTNDIFFILAIRTILKLECIKEKNELDLAAPEITKQITNISKISEDNVILVYSDCKSNNSLYVKQFIHKLCVSLPFLKHIIHDGNKSVEELISNNKTKPEIPRNILYNLSYYTIIDTDEHLMFSIATLMNNNSTFIFANKFIRPSLAEMIRLKVGQIDHKNCRTLEEIEDKRFVAI